MKLKNFSFESSSLWLQPEKSYMRFWLITSLKTITSIFNTCSYLAARGSQIIQCKLSILGTNCKATGLGRVAYHVEPIGTLKHMLVWFAFTVLQLQNTRQREVITRWIVTVTRETKGIEMTTLTQKRHAWSRTKKKQFSFSFLRNF